MRVLNTTFQAPVSLSSSFETTLRFCESDAGASNPRAEASVMEIRPGWAHCNGCVRRIKRTQLLAELGNFRSPTVSAIIHACKYLATSGAYAKMKVALRPVDRREVPIP